MPQPLYTFSLSRHDQPVAEPDQARRTLCRLFGEAPEFEPELPEFGDWLVCLPTPHAEQLEREGWLAIEVDGCRLDAEMP